MLQPPLRAADTAAFPSCCRRCSLPFVLPTLQLSLRAALALLPAYRHHVAGMAAVVFPCCWPCSLPLVLLTAYAAPDGRQYTLPEYSVVLPDVQLHNCTYDLAILTADAAPHGRQYTLPEYSVGLLDAATQLHL